MSVHEWIVTAHSVERYQERYAPEATEAQARAALKAAILTAAPLRQRSFSGESLWKTDCGVILITKFDRKKTVIVTVLSEAECAERMTRGRIPADEMELIREYAADLPLAGLPPSGKPISDLGLEAAPARRKEEKQRLDEALQQRNQRLIALRMQNDALAQENRILRKRLDLKKRAQELTTLDPAVKALEVSE